MSYAATIANPWIATPGRIEDEYNGRTVALKVNGSVDLATNDKGFGAIAFQPRLQQVQRIAGVSAGATGTVSWTAGAGGVGAVAFSIAGAPDYAALGAAYNAYRIVSFGVKCTYVGGETDAKGEVIIAHHQGVGDGALGTNITAYRENGHVHVQPLYEIKAPVYGACHNFDRPSFKALNGVDFYNEFPTTTVCVLAGYANASLLKIDWVMNLELIPIPGSLFEHLAKPSPSSSTGMAVARRLSPGRAGPSLSAVTAGASARVRSVLPSGTKKKRRYKSKSKFGGISGFRKGDYMSKAYKRSVQRYGVKRHNRFRKRLR